MELDLESAATGLVSVPPASMSQAVLQFLPDWLQAREGEILRGGNFSIEFAPERLTGCRRNWRGAEVWDIEALVKFHPRGELVHDDVMQQIPHRWRRDRTISETVGNYGSQRHDRNRDVVSQLCRDRRSLMLGDSRFGENYWFAVGGPDPVVPQDPVRYRDGAIPSPELVNVLDQAATKKNVFPAPPNGPLVGKDSGPSSTYARG